MNKLSIQKRAQVIGMLAEGNSLRATSRMADVSLTTVTKLLVEVGTACAAYQDAVLKDLPCKRVQCDEIWAFVGCKEKNVSKTRKDEFGLGDVYTWVGMCADTKIVPAFFVGRRDARCGNAFMQDLASRLNSRVQLTTDGLKVYLQAVENAFGADIDYAMLIKLYGSETREDQRRYSPVECTGTEIHMISGNPDVKKISTSFIERQNLTMRMSMRRFTRLTNAFSKKVDNHFYAVALYFMYYNFGRVHKTLRVTPTMECGVADHVWSLEEIARLANGHAYYPHLIARMAA
jgi:IS1 family transposase